MINSKVKVKKGDMVGENTLVFSVRLAMFYFLTWVGSSHVFIIILHLFNIQTHLGDISGWVPDYHNRVSHIL